MMMLKRFFFLSGMVGIILENLTCSERKLSLFGERFGLGDYFRDITNHVKRDFGEMIVFSGADGVEAGDGVSPLRRPLPRPLRLCHCPHPCCPPLR